MLTDLLRRFFQDGDAAAMENFVRRTRGRLLSIARRIGAAQDAEDSVQAAYHALLRHGAFRGPVSVEAWLTTAVVRIAYRRKALALRQTRLAERLACDRDDADPHDAAVRREEIALVRRAVTHLPSAYRDVLVLRHLEGLTVEETARLLDAPESTVKTRTRRGLALLRARVGPRAAWALMVGPWLLADVLRSTTTWGTVMTAKTTMTMAGVALAVTAVGLGVGMNLSKDAPTQRAAFESRHPDASLRDDVERWRARAESAERALAQARPPASASEQAELPPSLVREGRRLGVSDAALAAASAAKEAWDAFRKNRRTSAKWDEAMAALQTFGGEGFLAVLAHLRANPEPTGNYFKLFASTWEEGLEAHLIDLAQDSHASLKQRKHALLCLGGSRIDTPGVRDFLVAELERGGQEELIQGCAKALGWLREERAIPSLERYLYRPGKEKEAANFLVALGSIGTERARSVLVEFARGDHPGLLLVSAVKVLGWSDKNAAREAAKQILQGHRGEALAASHRRTLETVAAR